MNTRPASVTFSAICFVPLAIAAAGGAATQFFWFQANHHAFSLLRAAISFVLALVFASVAYGLWRLSNMARLIAVWLAVVDTCYALLLDVKSQSLRVELQTYGLAEWLGFAVGIGILLLWLGSPAWLLSRPVVVRVFRNRHEI